MNGDAVCRSGSTHSGNAARLLRERNRVDAVAVTGIHLPSGRLTSTEIVGSADRTPRGIECIESGD